ncbi:FecR family protein [Sneathiella sp.]|uniref:FecR family protein n=1 Tax=Sneathiella sp. TaxID=1964365 RepID=UPI0026355EE6|nr:FecR family protein [Sneathiella sp.]MDF2365810.1 FecR family protein [Sneathiella sp.]
MFKNLVVVLSLAAGLVFAFAENGIAANPDVGTVTRLQSDAKIIREGQTIPMEVGSVIRESDEINSENMARIEITFTDGTTLLIGENARIEIDEYLYDPGNNIGTAIISALQGPFRFITGKIGQLKDKRVEIKSSAGTIGVRGTDFWGGPSQGTYGVFLFEGVIVIFNAEGGRIVSTPGTGVDLDGIDKVPGEVTVWGASRAQAALATVTFR